jgi:hypothetical protein
LGFDGAAVAMPRTPQPPAPASPRRRSRAAAAVARAASAQRHTAADDAAALLAALAADSDEDAPVGVAASEEAAEAARAAASRRVGDREFAPMLLLGAITPPARSAMQLALLLLVAALCVTPARGAGMHAGVKSPKQALSSATRRVSFDAISGSIRDD